MTTSAKNPLDAKGLKALAHPLRIELLELLLDHGPSTASALARLTGNNSGTVSYHLRRLADVGLIEDADDIGTGRDRYWRATGGWALAPSSPTDRPTSESTLIVDHLTERRMRQIRAWLADQHRWSPAWQNAALMADTRLDLTADELAELSRQLLQTVLDYRAKATTSSRSDTARVIAQLQLFPIGPPPTNE